MKDSRLYLYLASGEINDIGFWLIGTKNTDSSILEDKNLIECHRKELIGFESAKEILEAINLNLDNFKRQLEEQHVFFDKPPMGISFNIPLFFLENIFDFWLEVYKNKEDWETCYGLLKIRKRASLANLIESKSIKGNSKKWAIKIERLHNYKPNLIKNNIKNEPMWK